MQSLVLADFYILDKELYKSVWLYAVHMCVKQIQK